VCEYVCVCCVCVCLCVRLVQTNVCESCSPISRLKLWNKSSMSIWREALSTCHECLTSALGGGGGSAGQTAAFSDVFSPGEKNLIAFA